MAKCVSLTVTDAAIHKRVHELAKGLGTSPTRVATMLLGAATSRAKIKSETITRDRLIIEGLTG